MPSFFFLARVVSNTQDTISTALEAQMNDKVMCRSITYHVLSIDFIKICIYIYIYNKWIYYICNTTKMFRPPSLFFYTNTLHCSFDDNLRRAAAAVVVSTPAAFRHHSCCSQIDFWNSRARFYFICFHFIICHCVTCVLGDPWEFTGLIELVSAYSSFQEISLSMRSNISICRWIACNFDARVACYVDWLCLKVEKSYSTRFGCAGTPWVAVPEKPWRPHIHIHTRKLRWIAASCRTFQTCSVAVEIVEAMKKQQAVASNHWAEALAYRKWRHHSWRYQRQIFCSSRWWHERRHWHSWWWRQHWHVA